MELGTGRNEVRLVEHDNAWEDEFKSVKKNLLEHTSLTDNQIEHIGSTAIKGILAKPIIDILVGVDSIESDTTELEKELRTCGFYRLRVNRQDEIVFAKFTDETFKIRTHYIHLTDINSDFWHNRIFFRDYLNAKDDAKKEYERIKLNFTDGKSEGIEEYTDFKEAFVKDIYSKR